MFDLTPHFLAWQLIGWLPNVRRRVVRHLWLLLVSVRILFKRIKIRSISCGRCRCQSLLFSWRVTRLLRRTFRRGTWETSQSTSLFFDRALICGALNGFPCSSGLVATHIFARHYANRAKRNKANVCTLSFFPSEMKKVTYEKSRFISRA